MAQPLDNDDLSHIQKQKRTETLFYEICLPQQIGPFSLLGVQFDRYLTNSLYIGGSALGAVAGGRGGYAEGTFNLGYQWTLPYAWATDIKVMLGGAGGGGVPVLGGLFFQPSITIIYSLSNEMQLRLGYGKFIALDTDFRADIFNCGITFVTQHLFLPF